MSEFNLEKRAEELFPCAKYDRSDALHLAREALEAAAKECEDERVQWRKSLDRAVSKDMRSRLCGGMDAAATCVSIIRRIANEKPGASQYGYAADTLDGVGAPYEQDTMSHEKPGASPHPSGDSSDDAADNLGSRTAERTSQPPAPLSDAEILRALEVAAAHTLIRCDPETSRKLREHAAKLRAAEEVDVFESFAAGEPALGLRAAVRARDWFGPLLEYTRRREVHGDADAKAVMDDIRERTH